MSHYNYSYRYRGRQDVSTQYGQHMTLGLIGSVEWIVIACREDLEDGWIMIPAENFLASYRGTGTRLPPL